MKIRFLFFWLATAMLVAGLSSCDNQEDEQGFYFEEPAGVFMEKEYVDGSLKVDTIVAFEGSSPEGDFRVWHRLPTGQTSCFDDSSEINCPEPGEMFFGQDSQHSNGVRSFVDNGNETVTDEDTGKIWQKGYKADVTWYEAESYCANLTLNAVKWRIPTPHELRTLVDYGIYDPAIDTAAFPDTPSEWFWADKHAYLIDVTAQQESSWIINFFDGFVEYTARYNVYNVRCIRAN